VSTYGKRFEKAFVDVYDSWPKFVGSARNTASELVQTITDRFELAENSVSLEILPRNVPAEQNYIHGTLTMCNISGNVNFLLSIKTAVTANDRTFAVVTRVPVSMRMRDDEWFISIGGSDSGLAAARQIDDVVDAIASTVEASHRETAMLRRLELPTLPPKR
jgi:hypothetical protein